MEVAGKIRHKIGHKLLELSFQKMVQKKSCWFSFRRSKIGTEGLERRNENTLFRTLVIDMVFLTANAPENGFNLCPFNHPANP